MQSPARCDCLQNDLKNLEEWANKWGMRFNAKKCYILRCSASKNPLTYFYELNSHILQEVDSSPYLGITFSNSLDWDAHINSICAKANSTLGFVKRNLKYAPPVLKATAYKSLVRSKLEYASVVWDPSKMKHVDMLEMVQRRAARFAVNDYRRTSSVTSMLESLGWPPLQLRRKEKRLSMLFKILHGEVAIRKEDYTSPGPSRTRRKNNIKLAVYTSRTSDFKNSFFPRTIAEWNLTAQAEIDAITSDSADTQRHQ